MSTTLKGLISSCLILLTCLEANAQDQPIASWQSHLPYNTAVSLATDDLKVYVATKYSFYTIGLYNDEIETFSKSSGMSDISMSKIAYDKSTGSLILTYTNSNIDVYKDGNFTNIPDLKLKTVTGTKQINHIYTENGLAYLSTDVGIVVINLDKAEVKETYEFSKNSENILIRGLASTDNEFFAATNKGLYKADKNSRSLQDFSSWTAVDTSRDLNSVANIGNKVFAASRDTLFYSEPDSIRYLYTKDSSIGSINNGIDCIWIVENNKNYSGDAKRMNSEFIITDSFTTISHATEIIDIADSDSTKLVSNLNLGLMKRTRKGDPFATILPNGPSGIASYDIIANNKELVVMHGGYDDIYAPSYNRDGFSTYKNGAWKEYNSKKFPVLDGLFDFTHAAKRNGVIYAGSSQSGLFVLNEDDSYEHFYKETFDGSSTGSNLYRVSGVAFDNDDVLWLTVLGGDPNELVARTKDGQWYKYSIPIGRSPAHSAAHLIIDDNNQKWFAAPRGNGLIVYDDNHTPETFIDDRYVQLRAGEGSGGLPNNEVYCLTKDKDGSIWIGTGDGIGIVSCPSDVISRQCEAEKRIVQFDQFAGYLFQGEQVNTIAVDGANRKWIGTNNGMWLISEDGDEIIERFTSNDSPLPSDIIRKIAIDPVTGDVYIGTELGLVSYRGNATEGGRENSDLITYPNPIPTGYSGSIAIRGFVENADVRITDVSGQLVYRTKALGGQVVWNGKDYTGRRPQSGVYMIFATDKDGTQTKTGKFVFME